MGHPRKADGALYEAVVFLSHFNDLPDPRQSGKVLYPLDEVLLLCLLAVLAGAESITDIARFGEKKLDLLRRFRPFADGTPAHDHLGDILATLDAEAFQRCFVAWVASVTGIAAEVIAIDGKTLRRSHNKKRDKPAIHMVSAFAARQRLVLGQVKVADKANEIVAIPAVNASSRTFGNPSNRELRTNTSPAVSHSPGDLVTPGSRTRLAIPRFRACCSSDLRSDPSPKMTRLHSG